MSNGVQHINLWEEKLGTTDETECNFGRSKPRLDGNEEEERDDDDDNDGDDNGEQEYKRDNFKCTQTCSSSREICPLEVLCNSPSNHDTGMQYFHRQQNLFPAQVVTQRRSDASLICFDTFLENRTGTVSDPCRFYMLQRLRQGSSLKWATFDFFTLFFLLRVGWD